MKIAYFLSELDLIFLDEKQYGHNIFAIVYKNSDQENCAKNVLKLPRIISITPKNKKRHIELTEEVIQNSNITEKIIENGIDALLITNSSKFFETWGIKNKITLLCPHYKLQKKFENKIFFENFLNKNKLPKPKGCVVNSLISKKPYQKAVLQIPDSWGNEGTFIIKSKKKFNKKLSELPMPILVREFKKGTPLSSSILIRKNGEIFLTSIERQCFYNTKNTTLNKFIGIQWFNYSYFKPKIFKKINAELIQIGKALHKAGLTGLINIDFILDEDSQINFIECNPRMACATNQIIAVDELRNKADLFKIFSDDLIYPFINKGKELANTILPKNDFKGCQMFIYFKNSQKWPKIVNKYIKSNFYTIQKDILQKIKLKNRFDFMRLKNGVFYYNRTNEKDVFNKDTQIGIVLVNFPLYEFKTGKLNKKGKLIYDYFHKN